MSQTAPETQPPAAPAAPARPDGISEEEWNALGDPGKQAIVRERTARADAERQLAAARARPTPPPGTPVTPAPAAPATAPAQASPPPPATPPGAQPDLAALISHAVTAAVAPLQQRIEGYETQTAAQRVHDAITSAAGDRFHDPADAFKNLDLTGVVDANGQPDGGKVTAALDKLLTDKPYLAKPTDGRRFASPGLGSGATPGATPGGATPPIGDQVKDVLAQMQKTTGINLPTS